MGQRLPSLSNAGLGLVSMLPAGARGDEELLLAFEQQRVIAERQGACSLLRSDHGREDVADTGA